MTAQLSPFGQQLRHWRKRRGLSQLDLAHRAEVSPRHVSFCETGRSRPGERMVLKLAEVLDVPLRDRNDLLRAAGLSPLYPERNLSDGALEPLRRVLDEMLRRQEPYPAYVIDRRWFLVDANRAARRLVRHISLDDGPVDALAVFFGDGPIRQMIVNWDEVAWEALARLRREALADPELIGRVADLEAQLGPVTPPRRDSIEQSPVICPKLRLGDRIISTVSVMARFGTAQDVTLDELRVELVYPADENAALFFEQLAASG